MESEANPSFCELPAMRKQLSGKVKGKRLFQWHLFIFFLFLIVFHSSLMAQQPVREYLNEHYVKTDTIEQAEYYRESIYNNKGNLEGEVKVYYKNGVLESIGQYQDGKRQEEHINYYRNGKIAEKQMYKDDSSVGKVYRWYQNGQQQEEGEWATPGSSLYKVISFWDSTGKQTVTNGTGELVEYMDGNTIFLREMYRDSVLIKGVSYGENGKQYEYETDREKMPEYEGGMSALAQYLRKSLKYPKEAIKKGVKGTVFVSFVVDYNGTIRDVGILGPKLGYGLEEEAIRVIAAMPAWQPGLQFGKAVAVRYSLPIKFFFM